MESELLVRFEELENELESLDVDSAVFQLVAEMCAIESLLLLRKTMGI